MLFAPEGDLDRLVAVAGHGFHLAYQARSQLDHGRGAHRAGVVGVFGHPELLSN
jgi:hypothetical protein